MERGMILVFAALMVYLASGVQGTSHLSFSNNTEVNVTRAGCGVSKLCVETPDDCDPTGSTSCLFASGVAGNPTPPNGTDLYIGLSGNSSGYIAIGLTANSSEGTTMLFICGQNSSTFFFRTMQRNNTDGMLAASERRVTEIRGNVTGDMIRCEFMIPGANATSSRASADTTYSILLGTGTVGSSLGNFNIALDSGPLNIADPTSNVATTTSAPGNTTTTGSSGAVQPHAVLLGATVLTLLAMLRV